MSAPMMATRDARRMKSFRVSVVAPQIATPMDG
jgi:hypothetical protein